MTQIANCKVGFQPMIRDNSFGRTTSPVNIRKYDDRFQIEVLAPGIEIEDIEINLEDERLSIRSKRKPETEIKYLKREFDYSGFERSFHLGQKIDGEKIEARLDSGILKIELLLRKDKMKRQIPIL